MVRRSGKTKMGTRTNTVEHREEKGGKKQKKERKREIDQVPIHQVTDIAPKKTWLLGQYLSYKPF